MQGSATFRAHHFRTDFGLTRADVVASHILGPHLESQRRAYAGAASA
jgi:hypothetical protein